MSGFHYEPKDVNVGDLRNVDTSQIVETPGHVLVRKAGTSINDPDAFVLGPGGGGGGGTGAPTTITLESQNVDVPSDTWHTISFGQIYELEVLRQFDVTVSLPTTSITWPIAGIINVYLEGYWEDYTQGGIVHAYLGDSPVWPSVGAARSPNLRPTNPVNATYRSFGPDVSDGIPITVGQALSLRIRQESGETQRLSSVRFGATLYE